MNMLLLMTPTEVADYGELHATTDLERALLGAIEHFEFDLDSKLEDAEAEREGAKEERDEVKDELAEAEKRIAALENQIEEAYFLLKGLVGNSLESTALFEVLLEKLEEEH